MTDRNPTVFDTGLDSHKRVGVLGEGGSGRVFEVSAAAGKRFAVKCLRPELTSTEKRKRFRNELAFCSKVDQLRSVERVSAEWRAMATCYSKGAVRP